MGCFMTLLVVAVAALLVPGPVMSIRPPLGAVKGVPGLHSNDRDLLSKCNRHWFHARLDHYSAVRVRAQHCVPCCHHRVFSSIAQAPVQLIVASRLVAIGVLLIHYYSAA